MAVYKVPQDVEADDKLLGPLSFRQFLYAVGAVISAIVTFFMGQLFIGLIIIPLPFLALFTILALPLRKDQPMEMYLLAIIRFMLKPRMRLWQPEGYVNMVEIVAPTVIEEQRTNGLSQDEARNRLGYLAQVMDSRGWSTRGVSYPGSGVDPSVGYADADITNEIMDVDESVAKKFESLIAQKDTQRDQQTRANVDKWRAQSAAHPVTAATSVAQTSPVSLDDIITQQQQIPLASPVSFDPYPTSIHQHVIQPLDDNHKQHKNALTNALVAQNETGSTKPVTTTVSPDIMNLVNESKNLSISTLSNEAHRLEQKQSENEVVISLH